MKESNVDEFRVCTPSRFHPVKWICDFYRPVLSWIANIDIQRCSCCGRLYQLSFAQCCACFVLFFICTCGTVLISYSKVIPEVFSIIFAVATYPLAIEIPRKCLKWKLAADGVYYSRWKSRGGLLLALFLGIQLGDIVAIMICV